MINGLMGSSDSFLAVLREVSLVAPVDCSVFLQGETGAGKEVVAQAIHDRSRRSAHPLVTVNCAAIPAGLLESELFGHERGAFTGAVNRRVGRFQAADRGTLFLDEIGDLPLELQPKLLRVLQDQQVDPVGSRSSFKVNVRVIAATHQHLWRMVQEGRFRADLFYRLNVYPIRVPALRDRQEDIPLLAKYFGQQFAERHGRRIEFIPPSALEAMKRYPWPGNVRELQNFIERAVIMSSGPGLELPLSELQVSYDQLEPVRTLADAERTHIVATLFDTNGVVGGPLGAARRLGLPRTTLISRMRKLGISRSGEQLPSTWQSPVAFGARAGGATCL